MLFEKQKAHVAGRLEIRLYVVLGADLGGLFPHLSLRNLDLVMSYIYSYIYLQLSTGTPVCHSLRLHTDNKLNQKTAVFVRQGIEYDDKTRQKSDSSVSIFSCSSGPPSLPFDSTAEAVSSLSTV